MVITEKQYKGSGFKLGSNWVHLTPRVVGSSHLYIYRDEPLNPEPSRLKYLFPDKNPLIHTSNTVVNLLNPKYTR